MSKTTTAIALLMVSAVATIATGANAMSLSSVANQGAVDAAPAIVDVHSVHPTCMWGPVSPSGTGPSKYHRTPEAGVHIMCQVPPRPGASGLTTTPKHQLKSGKNKLKLR